MTGVLRDHQRVMIALKAIQQDHRFLFCMDLVVKDVTPSMKLFLNDFYKNETYILNI